MKVNKHFTSFAVAALLAFTLTNQVFADLKKK